MFRWADSPKRGVNAVLHELRYGAPAVWNRWRKRREIAAKRKVLLASFDELRANPPDVLIGANISLSNGIRFHIEGIRSHSAMRVAFSPDDELLRRLTYHDVAVRFHDDVMAFDPRGIRVIHSHVYPYFIRWCRNWKESGARWVHTYHLPYFPIDGHMEPWQLEINDALINDARHAHVRLSVSRWQQRYLQGEHDIESIYLPNGVDAERCDRADAEAFRSAFGIEDFILFVGRNEAVKNPVDFLRLARALPDLRFAAVGPGMTPDSLRAFGELPKNLVALGGLAREQVQNALAACSALVVTSKREGLPTLVLEALLREKPVVVPDDAGCVEAVGGGRFGFVYNHNDLSDLTAKTLAALASVADDRRDARRWVLEEYDWKVVARQLDEIYRTGGTS